MQFFKIYSGIEDADCIMSEEQMKSLTLFNNTEQNGHNYVLSTESLFGNENEPISINTSGK